MFPYVEEWEIAGLHRNHHSHQGACVRVVWMHGTGDSADEKMEKGIDFYRTVTLPTLEQIDGFCSASLFVDRDTMRAVSSVTWDSRAAMEASRDAGMKLRAATSTQLGVDIMDVAEFDLLVAHLRGSGNGLSGTSVTGGPTGTAAISMSKATVRVSAQKAQPSAAQQSN